MKLLFTQDALVNAGAERSHLEILSRFRSDTEVAMVYFYPKQELKSDYEKAGVRLIFLDIPETYHFTLAVSRLVCLIRTEKPDLLISCLWRADIITRIASWITGVPLLGTLVNDSYSPMAWKDKKGLKYKVVYWLDRLTAGIPVHWIANAQALADSHVKTLGLSREKITVVYRGRPVIAPARRGGRDVIASASKQSFEENSKPKEKIASATKKPEDNSTLKESSLAMTSPEETASSAESSDVNSELSNSSLAVTGDVIASAAKQSFEENSKPKEKIASATKSPEDNSTLKESSLAMTSPEETSSSAESSDVNSDLSNSSLAVTGDVIASAAKQSPNEELSSIDKTASAPGFSEDKSTIQGRSLAVTGVTGVTAVTGVTKHFISYGRLLERKGFQDAIHAFAQVLKIYPDCTLTIFGQGPYRKQLETQIQHLGLSQSVFLPGKLTNPMDALIHGYFPNSASTSFTKASDHCLLTTANCFLFPSWYEGFSGALVEAMMAGIPIIASDIPMNLEAVTDGKTALTFKVGDPQDLFRKMKVALDHPEQMAAMGEEARRVAEARFDIEKIAREYEGVVKRISLPRPFPQ